MNYETLIAAHEKALKTEATDALEELLHDEATWESITASSLKKSGRTKEETLEWFADQHWESDLESRCIFESEDVNVITHKTPADDIVLLVTEFLNGQIMKFTHARGPSS